MQSEELPLSEALQLSEADLVVADNVKKIRLLSVLVLVIAVFAYIAMFFDPATGGATSSAYLQSMSDVRFSKGIVHGLAITAAAANIVGYMLVTVWLRNTGPLILIGMLVYFGGNAAIAVASFLDGFVAPGIATAFASAPISDTEAAFRALNFMGIAMTALAHIGWLLQGGAMLLLACGLLTAKKTNKKIKTAFVSGAIFVGVVCILAYFFLALFPQPAIKTIMAGTTLGSSLLAVLLWFSSIRSET